MNAVELSGVSKTFGDHTAVDRLDLIVPEAAVYGFIGPHRASGSARILVQPGLLASVIKRLSFQRAASVSETRWFVGTIAKRLG